jgi:hypothetical protein
MGENQFFILFSPSRFTVTPSGSGPARRMIRIFMTMRSEDHAILLAVHADV